MINWHECRVKVSENLGQAAALHALPLITPLSYDLNGLKNGPSKHFERSLKPMHLFQRLMGGMNRR
jgi:hypothetical protein